MEENRFVKLPTVLLNNEDKKDELKPKDKLIYVCIRKYMSAKTGVAFPSLKTIAADSSSSISTVQKSIAKLQENNYITVENVNKKLYYKFNPEKYFEPFSYEFLKLNDITFTEKAFLVAAQQYMFKDQYGVGKITYSCTELASKINMDRNTVSKCLKSLETKGYLTVTNTQTLQKPSGNRLSLISVNLEKLFQNIIWAMRQINDQVIQNTDDISKLQADTEENRADINMLKESYKALEKQNEYLAKENSYYRNVIEKIKQDKIRDLMLED